MYLFDQTKVYANYLSHNSPDATVKIKGSKKYHSLQGNVSFYQVKSGVLVTARLRGLPPAEAGDCGQRVFAFHIHNGTACTGNEKDSFADAGTHYNPGDCAHPFHPGDLPPVFSNDGTAWFAVLTNRFAVQDVIGRAVILHAGPDDFTTQPAGNAGEKIGCGIIRAK